MKRMSARVRSSVAMLVVGLAAWSSPRWVVMRVLRTGCWSIGLALMIACGPAIPLLPAQGGPAWLELRSEHFTLWTDASAERGRELMHELETRRQLLTTAMNRASSKTRSFVVALRSVRETSEYLPGLAIAAAWDARNPTGEPGMLLATTSDDDERVLSH